MNLQVKTHAEWFFENPEIDWGRRFVALHGDKALDVYTPLILNDPLAAFRVEAIFLAITEQVIKDQSEFDTFLESEAGKKLANFLASLSAATINCTDHLSEEVAVAMFSYWAIAKYAAAGKRTYQVLPGLTERLLHTELRGLDTDDLRLPFPAIYLIVPKSAGLRVWNRDSGFHALEGIYVFEARKAGVKAWRFLLVGERKQKAGHFGDDALFFFTLPLPEGQSLDLAVKAMLERLKGKAEIGGNDWTAAFWFVLNVVHYITSASARTEEFIQNKEGRDLLDRIAVLPKNSQKRDDLRARLKALDLKRRILVGVGVPGLSAPTGPGQHWKLNVRLLVAGHWKRQVHGEGRKLRKTIWIEPYWKGEETAPVVDGGVHVVGG